MDTSLAEVGLMEIPALKPEYEQEYRDSPPATCWVYEVWDIFGRLAHVGVADNFERRWRQHRDSSWWLGEIEIWYIHLSGYRTRSEARQVEAAAIHEQSPIYNTLQEDRYYRRYLGLWNDPLRPIDEQDCVPVNSRRFIPARMRVVK